MPKTEPAPRAEATRKLDWAELLETALSAPGDLHGAYSRLYPYSTTNMMYLLMQGVPVEPIATLRRWNTLGRRVIRGAKAAEIIRPVVVKNREAAEGDADDKKVIFLPKRCIFPISATVGEELPPAEHPEWNYQKALGALAIQEVPFKSMTANLQGYSQGRSIAVSPIAAYPMKTRTHEISHVVAGHTTPDNMEEYEHHRGIREFVAEGSAHLIMTELGLMDERQASVSRGYIRHWMQEQRPPDQAVRQVFSTADAILKAGRPEPIVESEQ